jgi:hypothetical protein
MPVRKVSNHSRNVIGRFPSAKMGRMIAFESLLERDFIYLLEYDPSVKWFEEQPLSIKYLQEGKQFQYTPDFHLLENGQHVLVECKPQRFVETEENRHKFAVARVWCRECGWEFRLMTDQQIRAGFRLKNVKLLAQYARQKVDAVMRSQIQSYLHDTQSVVSISNLSNIILPENPQTVMAGILCLAYHHEVVLALDDAPISDITTVLKPHAKEIGQ